MTDKHTALTDIPENKNFLSPLGFKFYIKRCPHVNYFLHRVNVPGLTTVHPETTNPFVNLHHSADHAMFQPLEATFRVDEDLQNYLEIHSWIRNLTFMDDFTEYASLNRHPDYTGIGTKSEIMLTVLSSQKNPKIAFTFTGCMPVSLSDIQFDASLGEVQHAVATVQFVYDNFDYDRDL